LTRKKEVTRGRGRGSRRREEDSIITGKDS